MVSEEEIDLREYIHVLIKRKWLILSFFLIVIIAAAIFSYFIIEPVYQSSATILFKPPEVESKLVHNYSITELAHLFKDIEIEEKIIKDMELNKAPYYLTVADLEEKASVDISEELNIIKILFQYKNPELTKNILTQWVETFIKKYNEEYLNQINETYLSKKSQYESSKEELTEVEERKIKFEVDRNVGILKKEIASKRSYLENYQNRLREINLGINKEKAGRTIISQELEKQTKTINLHRTIYSDEAYLQELLSKIAKNDLECIDPRFVVEEKNPIYFDLYQKLLNSEILTRKLEVEEKETLSYIHLLSEEIDDLNQQLISRYLQLFDLNREYALIKENYNNIQSDFKEIERLHNTKTDLLEIQRHTLLPQFPVKPNKELNIAIAAVLGLFLGVFIAFFVEFWQSNENQNSTKKQA